MLSVVQCLNSMTQELDDQKLLCSHTRKNVDAGERKTKSIRKKHSTQ